MDKAGCREIFERVRRASSADGLEVMLVAGRNALTRFANNFIHQNVEEETAVLSVRAVIGKRTARASTNRLDEESIQRVTAEAEALARVQGEDPELLPVAEPAAYQNVDRFDAVTSEAAPDFRAEQVRRAVSAAEQEGLTAAGIYSTGESTEAILNSRGLFAWHRQTRAEASITMMAEDSSGWAKASAVRAADVDLERLAARAAAKAVASRRPLEAAPGRYTVVLEPAAVLDLLGFLVWDFSATAVRDQRSFLTGRLGQQVFGPNITIWDDAYHPQQAGPPFDGEGTPRQPVLLVENGVVRSITYSRQAARAAGVEPSGHGFPLPNELGEAPVNIVVSGGTSSLEDMIASTERGILVTRLWYIREVDPYEKILTGMTRDGTFLIEDGRIRHGLRNFRFNQSMIELLNSVELLGPASRAAGEEAFEMVVPAMKARGFQFAEVTKF
jgi:predicted Zn-dependent protease